MMMPGQVNMPLRRLLLLVTLHILLNNSSCFIAYTRYKKIQTSLDAFFLNSALESLTERRSAETDAFQPGCIDWLNLDASNSNVPKDTLQSSLLSVPLYPLSAVYLPFTGVNHTLNNVQPRTMRMALDLQEIDSVEDRLFCAVLCTMDTGRIAKTGTLMQVISVQSTPSRVMVTCLPVALVDIVAVENPQAASIEARIRRTNEYLRAQVRKRSDCGDDLTDKMELERLAEQVCQSYNSVRDMYVNNGVGAAELPPFANDKLDESLPQLQTINMTDNFWNVAQLWQTLCYTVREGRQINLAADRNALMVDSIVKRQKGPINLPIQMDDLAPEDRSKVEQLEIDAQEEWLSLQLDPCLDFQELLCLPFIRDRLKWLGHMIGREEDRLQELVRNPPKSKEEEPMLVAERRGAWFDEDW